MKYYLIAFAMIMALAISANVSATPIVSLIEPPDGFSAENGTTIDLTASVKDEVTDVNGTLCVTYDVEGGKGLCCSPSYGGIIECDILNVPVTFGTKYWTANFTSNDSVLYLANETRSYIGIYSDRTLIPIYPILNETVIGESNNFVVNYTVDLYLPYEIKYSLSIRFYGYSSYRGSPLYSSEKLICAVIVNGSETNPISSGIHRYVCTNYMYDSYYINYEELPNEKFWKAKLRVIDGEVDGANLLSDTGYQRYNYQINSNLAHVFPPDETVYCDNWIYFFNGSLYNLAGLCWEGKSWRNKEIGFNSYLRDDGCNGGDLDFNLMNAINGSQSYVLSLNSLPNATEDYYEVFTTIGSKNPSNVTYTYMGEPLTAVHFIYNWTYTCNNGTTYTTPTKDLWYIIGVGGAGANITSEYPAYPICTINETAIMPMFAEYWGAFFGGNMALGMAMIAFFFIIAISIFVTLNSDIIGGASVAIFGMLVFERICYLPIALAYIKLIIAGLIVVYFIRKSILGGD